MGKIHKKLEMIIEHDESCDQMRGRGGCSCEMKMFAKRLSIEAAQAELPNPPELSSLESNQIRRFTFTRPLTNNQTKELFDVLLASRFRERSQLIATPAEGKPGVRHITGVVAHPDDVRLFAGVCGLRMQ
jgi:hypothetical protein